VIYFCNRFQEGRRETDFFCVARVGHIVRRGLSRRTRLNITALARPRSIAGATAWPRYTPKALLVVRDDKIVYEWYAPGEDANKKRHGIAHILNVDGGFGAAGLAL